MRPVLTDRMAVIGIVAALVLWVCCLTVLWGWAYDSAGSFAMLTILSILAASWVCTWQRRRLFDWAEGVLRAFRLRGQVPLAAAMEGRLGSGRDDVRQRMRILSAAAVTAVAGFVLGTLWIPLVKFIAAMLGQVFLFSGWTWRVLELLALLAGAFPVALGLVAVLFASKVVREAGGRDVYAGICRDWLWGVAVAFGAFAVSWYFGANLIFLVFSLAAMILLVALTGVTRVELSTHPRRRLLPFGPPGRLSRLTIAAAVAGLMLVLIIQMRFLGDVFGLGLTRRMLWVFLSLGMLAYFLGRADRKSRPPSRRQVAASLIGLAAALLAQSTEIIVCLSLPADWPGWFDWFSVLPTPSSVLAAMAVATQVPLAALAATLLTHQRRNFAVAGGTVGQYLWAVFAGLTGAAAAYLLLGVIDGGWMVLPAAAGVIMLGGAADALRLAGRLLERVRWFVWPAGLCAAMLVGLAAAVGGAGPQARIVQPGLWLSAEGELNRAMHRYRQYGVLPSLPARRSAVITACLYGDSETDAENLGEGIFAMRRGRWWIVCSAAADLPDETPGRFYAYGSNPEPPPQPRRYKRRPPLSYSDPDYFRYARLNFVAARGCDYYDGVFLAPLPADHPQAWRCYNEQTMRRCRRLAEMRNPDGTVACGLVVLRTQVARGRVRQALSVARTFHKAVRSGWAVVAVRRSGLDMLLVGPNEALAARHDENGNILLEDVRTFLIEKTALAGNVYVVPIEELWQAYPGVAPIRLSNPPPERLADTPRIEGLRNYLEKTRKIRQLQQERQEQSS